MRPRKINIRRSMSAAHLFVPDFQHTPYNIRLWWLISLKALPAHHRTHNNWIHTYALARDAGGEIVSVGSCSGVAMVTRSRVGRSAPSVLLPGNGGLCRAARRRSQKKRTRRILIGCLWRTSCRSNSAGILLKSQNCRGSSRVPSSRRAAAKWGLPYYVLFLLGKLIQLENSSGN